MPSLADMTHQEGLSVAAGQGGFRRLIRLARGLIRHFGWLGLLAGTVVGAAAQENRAPQLYLQHCAVCHGARLEGAIGPALLNNPWKHGQDDESVTRSIVEGFPELGMIAYRDILTAEQTRAVVIYLREQRAAEVRAERPAPSLQDGGIYPSRHHAIQVEILRDDFEIPWGVATLPDGRLLVTEKRGELLLLSPDGRLRTVVSGTPAVAADGQGGLLDVAIDPDYRRNGWIYLAFSERPPEQPASDLSLTTVARGRLDGSRWTDHQVLFRGDPAAYSRGGLHFGTRIVFDASGRLLFAIGDRGRDAQAQNRADPRGAIHRIERDGSIPADNPFLPEAAEGLALPSLYTYGHRNPQGLAVHPQTGQIWAAEHGPRGGDELNLIEPRNNYGWPEVTLGMNYDGTPRQAVTSAPGRVDPVYEWTPSIAVCGITFVTGSIFPGWKNDLLAASLKFGQLHRLRLGADGQVVEEEVLLNNLDRVRHVASAPDGSLLVLLERPGRLVRLTAAP